MAQATAQNQRKIMSNQSAIIGNQTKILRNQEGDSHKPEADHQEPGQDSQEVTGVVAPSTISRAHHAAAALVVDRIARSRNNASRSDPHDRRTTRPSGELEAPDHSRATISGRRTPSMRQASMDSTKAPSHPQAS